MLFGVSGLLLLLFYYIGSHEDLAVCPGAGVQARVPRSGESHSSIHTGRGDQPARGE